MHAKHPDTGNPLAAGNSMKQVLDEELGSFDGLDACDIPDRDARVAVIAQRMLHAIRTILIGMNRDYERCGKSVCARSRRCRGFACEPPTGSRVR